MKKFSVRDVDFPLSDRARILKLLIASYVGCLLVALFGFRATSAISVSALMTLPYGTSVTNTRQYVRKRFLAQLIGVAVGYPLYLLFFQTDFVPVFHRFSLSMTLSLLITLWINRHFKLNIPDITMLMPGYLVILMTPGYALYPAMRPVYVLLGIVIGYGLNVWLFPPHYGRLAEARLQTSRECLRAVMDGGCGQMRSEAEHAQLGRAEHALQDAETYLTLLKGDLKACKKYRGYAPRLDHWERRLKADRAAIAALQALASTPEGSPALQGDCFAALQTLFRLHRGLFDEAQSGEETEALSWPHTDQPGEITVLARLVAYQNTLLDGAAVMTGASPRAEGVI